MSDCVKCSARLKPAALFCTKCGTKVAPAAAAKEPAKPKEAPVAPAAAAPTNECKQCHAALRPNALFCTKCGTKTAEGNASAKSPVKAVRDDGSRSGVSTPTQSRNASVIEDAAPAQRKESNSPRPVVKAATPPPSTTATTSSALDRSGDAVAKQVLSPRLGKAPSATTTTTTTTAAAKEPPAATVLDKSSDAVKLSPRLGKNNVAAEAPKSNTSSPIPESKKAKPADAKETPPSTPAAGDARCCSNCKAPLRVGGMFCTKCGTKQTADETPKKAPAATSPTPERKPVTASPAVAKKNTGEVTPPPPEKKPVTASPAVAKKSAGEATPPPASVTKPATTAAAAAPAKKTADVPALKEPMPAVPAMVPRDVSPRKQTVGRGKSHTGPSPAEEAARGAAANKASSGGNTLQVPVVQETRKGSFRESIVIPRGAFRESMVISEDEREAAMAKIDEMLGGSSEARDVHLTCIMDNVKKQLVVEALSGIINGRSIQIAWNLSPEQELHVTFVGLRAPNGDEIPFEVSEDVPWPHIPLWEEVLFEDEQYEILYEDDRDGDVEQLTPAEVAKLESEFNKMDVDKLGHLTRDGLTRFFTESYAQQVRDREGQLDKIMRTGALSNSRKVAIGANLKLDPDARAHITEQVERIMAMDIAGAGHVQLHEYARACASRLALERASLARQSERGKRMSMAVTGSGRGTRK